MTEAEWVSCADPQQMLEYLQSLGRESAHKMRLFAVACCRLLFRTVRVHPWFERGVNVAECFADGAVSPDDLLRSSGYPPEDWRLQMSTEPTSNQLATMNESFKVPTIAQNACWNAEEMESGIIMADCAALNAAWAATQPGTVMADDNGVSPRAARGGTGYSVRSSSRHIRSVHFCVCPRLLARLAGWHDPDTGPRHLRRPRLRSPTNPRRRPRRRWLRQRRHPRPLP